MKKFNRGGRELPIYQVSNSLDSNLIITSNTPVINGLAKLTSDEKNSYASYLASLIFDYQLKLKYASISLLTFLTMLSFDFAYAQEITKSEIVPLQIGDTIPEALWDMPLQVLNHPEGKDTIRLADYRDKKLIILDFWATWCAPCLASMNGLPELIDEFGDDVLFLPSSYENCDKIKSLLYQKKWNFMSEYQSKGLRDYFLFQGIPFIVWIKDNKIYSFTSAQYLKANTLSKVVKNESVQMIERNSTDKINPSSPVSNINHVYTLTFGKGHPAQTGGYSNVLNHMSGYNMTFLSVLKTLYASTKQKDGQPYNFYWSIDDSLKTALSQFHSYTGDYDVDEKIRDWRNTYLFSYQLEVDTIANLSRIQQLDILRAGFKKLVEHMHKVSFDEEVMDTEAWVVAVDSDFDKSQKQFQSQNGRLDNLQKMTWQAFKKKLQLYFAKESLPLVFEGQLADNQLLVCPEYILDRKGAYIDKLKNAGISITKKQQRLPMIHVKPYSPQL